MKTVIFEVSSEEDVNARFIRVWETGIPEAAAHYSFVTPELMSKMLTENRLHLLETLCGAGPLSADEVARRAGQDVDEVRIELDAMLIGGLIGKAKNGKVVFPFDEFKVNFLSHAA
jgi:predicted transcriptional regulator